jgi:hypothetical protein
MNIVGCSRPSKIILLLSTTSWDIPQFSNVFVYDLQTEDKKSGSYNRAFKNHHPQPGFKGGSSRRRRWVAPAKAAQ